MLIDRDEVIAIIEYMIRNDSYIEYENKKQVVSVEDIKNAIRLIENLPTTEIE